eukprot:1161035-Pelagomonas_calceolata.AAC.4
MPGVEHPVAWAGAGDGWGGANFGDAGMVARCIPPEALLGGPAPCCSGGVDVRGGGAGPLLLTEVLKSRECKKESRACT